MSGRKPWCDSDVCQHIHIAQDHSWDSLAIYTLNISWIESWPDVCHIILGNCSLSF